MKKIVTLMLALMLVLSMGTALADGPEKIVFWHSMSGVNGATLTEIVEAFNASQTQYEVVMEYQGSYTDTITKLKSTPEGMRPDVIQLAETNTCWMAYSDYYIPMQQYLDAAGIKTSDYQEAILGYYTLNGQLLSMPFNCSVPAIIYNVDVLKAAGIEPEQLSTLDGVLAASKTIVEKGLARYGCTFNADGFVFENYFGMLGAQMVDANNGHSGVATKMVIDENGSAKVLFSKWLELCKDDSVIPYATANEAKKEFSAGNVALYIGSCGAFSTLRSGAKGIFDVAIRALPKIHAEDAYNLTTGGGSLWIVNNGENTKNEGSFEFIKFTASTEMQVKWAMATGYLPVSRAAQDTPEYQEFLKNTFDFASVIAAMEESDKEKTGPLFGVTAAWRSAMTNECMLMLEDDSYTVDDCIATIVEQVNDEIEVYNEANNLV